MSAIVAPSQHDFRRALDACVTITRDAPCTSSEDGALRGQAFFGSALAGPPGRLHGGLHAYARVISVLRELRGEAGLASAFPLRARLRLERPLMLEEPIDFTGTYEEHAASFTLHTRFTGSAKLDARAESAPPLGPADVAPFRAALARCETEPSRTLMIRDSFPVTAYQSACVLTLDEAFFAHAGNELLAARPLDHGVDAALMCLALDWIGAIGMGVLWRARLYTTELQLQLDALALPSGESYVVVVDCTRPEVDPEHALAPVLLHGAEVRATSLPVALLSHDHQRAFATGRVTLLPWAGQTERLGSPPPK